MDERTTEKPLRVALYVRVSTGEQDLEHQEADLRRFVERRGWTVGAVYAEKASGASEQRPELARLRSDAARRRFRAVVVWAIDRLGRSALEVLVVGEELFKRGVGLVSYQEPAVDTATPQGLLVLQVAAAFAQFERAALSRRTRSGMAGAQARGVHCGRPRARVEPVQAEYVLEQQGGRKAAAARVLGVSVDTLNRRLREAAARRAAAAVAPATLEEEPAKGGPPPGEGPR
jgi:DNA invertase Pin-like site-specific DNA recombinase